MTKKIVGYVRVSSDGQVDSGFSLDIQRERVDLYARSQGTPIAEDDFFVDDGYSGTTLDRPALKRLIEACEAGEIAKVVVYRIDRLSRSQRRLLELIEDVFVANDVAFVSVSESFDTSTPFGRACLGILGVFAQLDRDQTVERLANGRAARAASGERAVGAVPYGYRSVEDGKRKVTMVDEETAPVVRRIFSLRDAGKSMQAIASDLNRDGIAAPRGERWHGETIRRILDNRIYRGSIVYNAGGITPIVGANENLALV